MSILTRLLIITPLLKKKWSTYWMDTKITANEVTKAIGKLKFNKSAGNDSIYNEMIKSGSEILSSSLSKLFNLILEKGYFPPKWTVGYIVPIYKSESPDNPRNYRGISISSCLGKLIISVINNRITEFVYTNDLIKFNQIGFRKGYSTTDHVFVMKTLTHSYLNKDKKLYLCFVDFVKAYDLWEKRIFTN